MFDCHVREIILPQSIISVYSICQCDDCRFLNSSDFSLVTPPPGHSQIPCDQSIGILMQRFHSLVMDVITAHR